MNPASRQDIQNIVDTAQNRMCQRIAMKQDIVGVYDSLKSISYLLQQNQQLLKQSEYQRLQLTRRAVALESRLAQLEQEIRGYRSTLEKVASIQAQQPRQIVIPAPSGQPEPQAQYVYRPA